MAGHSKWANIRHRKGAQDAKRGKVFTKIQREIAVAVKTGGGTDPDNNPRLRHAIKEARRANMPGDNIKKAILKASGTEGSGLVEVTFEGHGPGGVSVFVEGATDNKTRTLSQVRHLFSKHGGKLGKDGCLDPIFEHKAIFAIEAQNLEEESFTLELIDLGAEEVELEEGVFRVIAPLEEFGPLERALAQRGIEVQEAGLGRIPMIFVSPEEAKRKQILRLVDALEEDDDIQRVYHNMNS